MFRFVILVLSLLPASAFGQDRAAQIARIVDENVLAGFEQLQSDAEALSVAAGATCDVTDATLRQTYKDAFLSWSRVSHLRFGPTEEDNRGFALAFWPDPRGKTPKTLAGLIAGGDATLLDPAVFKEQSVAIRGFYALDFLLYDPQFSDLGEPEFRCNVMRAVANDIASTSRELAQGWAALGADLKAPNETTTYRSEEEVLRVLFKSTSGGMQFTSEIRLARPLGTFERPRPKRAEARRSGLSRDLVQAAVAGAGTLAVMLAESNPELAARLQTGVTTIMADLQSLDDPAFAEVGTPQGRIRVEAIQTSIDVLRRSLDQELGPYLGVSAGFNALDGD